MYYLGVDVGGTNIAVGIVDENNAIIAKASHPTPVPCSEDAFCDAILAVCNDALAKAGLTLDDVPWIGIGCPGTVNRATGIIEYSNNLGFHNTPMVKYLETELGKPTFIENDANAAAYGEYVAGAAKGAKNAVCITLGTGVGAGIIIDGKIYSGSNFGGAEVGHTVISVDGPQCTCGRKGCFEVYSSATGLVRMTKEALEAHPESTMKEEEHISARTAFNYMRAGDATAKQVVDDYIKYLAAGITNTINIFQPEVLSIGGGISNEGDSLLETLVPLIRAEVYGHGVVPDTRICIAELKNNAGIIGGAVLGLVWMGVKEHD